MGMIIKYVYSKSKRTLVQKDRGYLLGIETIVDMECNPTVKLKKREWETYNFEPIGVIVAIGPDKIGWSKVNESEPTEFIAQWVKGDIDTFPHKDKFNKKIGKAFAIERAQKGNIGLIPKKLKADYDWVVEHAKDKKW